MFWISSKWWPASSWDIPIEAVRGNIAGIVLTMARLVDEWSCPEGALDWINDSWMVKHVKFFFPLHWNLASLMSLCFMHVKMQSTDGCNLCSNRQYFFAHSVRLNLRTEPYKYEHFKLLNDKILSQGTLHFLRSFLVTRSLVSLFVYVQLMAS